MEKGKNMMNQVIATPYILMTIIGAIVSFILITIATIKYLIT